jgi:hypothetical protein
MKFCQSADAIKSSSPNQSPISAQPGSGRQVGVGAVALGCISVLSNPDVSFELAMFRKLLTQVSSSLTGL